MKRFSNSCRFRSGPVKRMISVPNYNMATHVDPLVKVKLGDQGVNHDLGGDLIQIRMNILYPPGNDHISRLGKFGK